MFNPVQLIQSNETPYGHYTENNDEVGINYIHLCYIEGRMVHI